MRITPEQAAARAKANMAQNTSVGMRKVRAQVQAEEPLEYLGEVNFLSDVDATMYLFKKEEDGTYVLTPNDDSFIEVLATWEGMNDDDSYPPNMLDWIKGYEEEMRWYLSHEIPESGEQGPLNAPSNSEQRRLISPLLGNNTWNQKAPYNNNLIFDGTRMLVGCNAVAISQIAYYWACIVQNKFRGGCKEIDPKVLGMNYDGLPPISTFDYEYMTNGTFSTNKETKARQHKAVATLCEYVSKGVGSTFGTEITTAYMDYEDKKKNIRKGDLRFLIEKINLGKEGITKKIISTDKTWESNIYNELAANRPVLMTGYKNSKSEGGHCFVCDGYDPTTDKYHFNWGWGSSTQGSQYGGGWYAIDSVGIYKQGAGWERNYNYNKVAIIGIEPVYRKWDINSDDRIDVTDIMLAVDCINRGIYMPAADIDNDGKVTDADLRKIIDAVLGR